MKSVVSYIICHADLRPEVGLTLSLKLTKYKFHIIFFKIRLTSEFFLSCAIFKIQYMDVMALGIVDVSVFVSLQNYKK